MAVPDLGHARAEPERVLAPGGEVRGGVDVPVGHMAAGVVTAAVGALGEGELGSHRTTRRARLGRGEPPVRDDALPARIMMPITNNARFICASFSETRIQSY